MRLFPTKPPLRNNSSTSKFIDLYNLSSNRMIIRLKNCICFITKLVTAT